MVRAAGAGARGGVNGCDVRGGPLEPRRPVCSPSQCSAWKTLRIVTSSTSWASAATSGSSGAPPRREAAERFLLRPLLASFSANAPERTDRDRKLTGTLRLRGWSQRRRRDGIGGSWRQIVAAPAQAGLDTCAILNGGVWTPGQAVPVRIRATERQRIGRAREVVCALKSSAYPAPVARERRSASTGGGLLHAHSAAAAPRCRYEAHLLAGTACSAWSQRQR